MRKILILLFISIFIFNVFSSEKKYSFKKIDINKINALKKRLTVYKKSTKKLVSNEKIKVTIKNKFGEKEYDFEDYIDSKGNIVLPLIKKTSVINLEVEELRDKLKKEYSKYIIEPIIEVSLKESVDKKIYILGEVKTPGGIIYKDKIDILTLISKSGNFNETADLRNSYIIRHDGKKVKVDLKELIDYGNISFNYELFPGDMLIVPKFKVDHSIIVLGNVNAPGRFQFEEGLRVFDAISMANGIKTVDDIVFKKIKEIKIVRRSSGLKKQIITLDAQNVFIRQSSDDNIKLMPGDIVYVPDIKIDGITNFLDRISKFLNFYNLLDSTIQK